MNAIQQVGLVACAHKKRRTKCFRYKAKHKHVLATRHNGKMLRKCTTIENLPVLFLLSTPQIKAKFYL